MPKSVPLLMREKSVNKTIVLEIRFPVHRCTQPSIRQLKENVKLSDLRNIMRLDRITANKRFIAEIYQATVGGFRYVTCIKMFTFEVGDEKPKKHLHRA